jgi:hypothetical protein
VECSQDRPPALDLAELLQACPFVDGRAPTVAVKLGNLARRGRPALPTGWLLLRVEVAPRVRPVCLCLVQVVQAKHVPVVLLASVLLLVASFLRQEAFLLLRETHGPVYLLDQAKPAPLRRLEPLAARQLLAADFRLREPQRQSAEERSWDFPS